MLQTVQRKLIWRVGVHKHGTASGCDDALVRTYALKLNHHEMCLELADFAYIDALALW